MIRDILLAGGIVLAPAGQLSMGLPAGFAEVLLFCFISVSAARMLWDGRIEVTPAFVRLGIFWLVFAMTLAVGFFVGYFTAQTQILGFILHDSLAFGLMMTTSLMIAGRQNAVFHMRRSAWLLIGFANVALLAQLAAGWGLVSQPGITPWLGDRFQGWSENPNQLALYCTAYGLLALHLATTSEKPLARILGFTALVIPLYVGRLTKSDAFLLASIVGYLTFGVLSLSSWLGASAQRHGLRQQVAGVLLVALLPLTVALSPQLFARPVNVETIAASMTRGGGGEATQESAALRLYLWKAAVDAGMTSGSLGLGPGPHLERPPVSFRQTLPELFEAHNTILDTFTQGGMIAVLSLAWIVTTAILFAWRVRADALVAVVLSLAVFGLTHLIIRHPIVWFSVAACLLAGAPALGRKTI